MGIQPRHPSVEALQGPEGASDPDGLLRKKEHRDPVPVRYWISGLTAPTCGLARLRLASKNLCKFYIKMTARASWKNILTVL